MSRQLQMYGTQQVMTSDPVTLVALLYDKAVLSLKTAVEAIGKNEIENRWRANNKAMEIIKHLLMTLDMEKGGEIASNLEAVYGYMLRRLVDVDIRNDARAAEEVIKLLEPLRSSWSELAHATRDIAPGDPALQTLAARAGEDAPSGGRPGSPRAAARPAAQTRSQGAEKPPAPAGNVSLTV